MTETQSTSPLEWFINSLLQSTAQLMVIVDHMQRHPGDASTDSIDDTLRTLLAGVLEPEFSRRDPSEFADAASLLACARHAIGEEIFLVEPDRLNRAERRRRRRGMH
jgi:hypothetical protein